MMHSSIEIPDFKMHSPSVAHSFIVSPIIRSIANARINSGGISIRSGITRTRAKDIFRNEGEDATLDEIARLAALVGMELSIVPEDCGHRAFTEVERYPVHHIDTSSYAARAVNMVEKVADLCIDLRLSTQLSSVEFEKRFAASPEFMAKLSHEGAVGELTVGDMHGYLTRFGAALATFPKASAYTNYYRALMELEPETEFTPIATALKVA